MSDANYKLRIVNQTGYDIYLSVGPWADNYSSCITIGDGSPGQLGSVSPLLFGTTMEIFFWRSGSCHGEQGWLSLMATFLRPDGNDNDYQQFWFDTDGGFSKYGRNSSYNNNLSYLTTEGDTRIYQCVFTGAAKPPAQWPAPYCTTPYPLDLQYTHTFDQVWNDTGSGAIFDGAIYRPHLDGYFNLGFLSDGPFQIASSGYINTRMALVARGLETGALALPVDYEWIGDDHNTGARTDCSWWRPVPPSGYVALGTAFVSYHGKPPQDAMACVRSDLAGPAKGGRMMYADRGSGGSHDLSLFEIKPNGPAINTGSSIALPTYFPGEPPACGSSDLHTLSAPNVAPVLTEQEIKDIIDRNGPILHMHPTEEFMPMTVDAFLADAYLMPDNIHLNIHNESTKNGDLAGAKAYVYAYQVHPCFTDIQFWFFYGNNGKTFIKVKVWGEGSGIAKGQLIDKNFDNLNNGEHIGDWEHVTLRVAHSTKQVVAVCYSAHGDGSWYAPNSTGNIQVYSALHMHGTYPSAGEHYELAAWVPKDSLEVRIYSRNICADGGGQLDASKKYEFIGSNIFSVTAPGWLTDYRDKRWGPPVSEHDSLEIIPHIFTYSYDGNEEGPSTPEFLYE